MKRINKKQYVDTKFVESDIDNWMWHAILQTQRKLNYSGLNKLVPKLKQVASIIPVSMIKATLKADSATNHSSEDESSRRRTRTYNIITTKRDMASWYML